ncbi:MAG: spermidine synthase, partial [Bacteroidales bacterium]|nr:spermidine synthase [Bacteroidales bacterium]
CYKALKEDGIMVNQHQSPFYAEDQVETQKAHRRIYECFPISKVYQAHIPTYPSGYWLFGFASKKYHPVRDLKVREWNRMGIQTDYYTTNLHKGCFALPAYVERMLKTVEKEMD